MYEAESCIVFPGRNILIATGACSTWYAANNASGRAVEQAIEEQDERPLAIITRITKVGP